MRKILFIIFSLCFVFGDEVVYDGNNGQLVNGWENWSWAVVSLKSTDVVASGNTYSIAMVCADFKAFYAHNNELFTSKDFKSLSFSINGGSTGKEPIYIQFVSNTDAVGKSLSLSTYIGGELDVMKWTKVSIPLSAFEIDDAQLNGFWISAGQNSQGTVYIDDISLESAAPPPVDPVTVKLANTNRHAISDLIFGVNFADNTMLQKNKYTVNRWGGEAVTRYAWDVDAANHASDWYFEDLVADADPSHLPFNSSADNFISTTLANNALPIVTLPLIGWAPFDRQTRCGFSVKKYGPQKSTDPYQPDCGNGVKMDGTNVVGNDPKDTSRVIDENYVLKWLSHMDSVFGKAKIQHFELDNEPGLWNTIHRDVHPLPLTYDELWNRTVQYAGAVRKAYPTAKIYGPIPWGWCEYFFSPQDGCSSGPDRKAHGDVPMLQWYISKLADYKKQYNVQLVDVIDVHVYPQGTNVGGNDQDPTTAALRLRSTRGLWDKSYVDESWINQPLYLIPRIQGYIDQYLPNLRIAVSEYNWGGDEIITGALAQVMILGIFARENVYLATRWVAPTSNSKTENAFQLFTNYDGKGASVKGSSILTSSTHEDVISAFGFINSNTVYVVAVNQRGDASVPVTVDLSAFSQTGKGTLYSFSASDNVSNKGSVTVAQGKATFTAPAWSASLVVIDF